MIVMWAWEKLASMTGKESFITWEEDPLDGARVFFTCLKWPSTMHMLSCVVFAKYRGHPVA